MTTETMARTGVYECMFLATQQAAAQFGDLIAHINDIVARAHGEVVAMRKWDDRRLAYEIDKQKRGVYILAYVSCPTDQVAHLERDVTISDRLLRVLVLKADHLTDEEIASHDDRRGLADEAKFRAERAESGEDEAQSRVRLGAPEQNAPASSESDESGDTDTDSDED